MTCAFCDAKFRANRLFDELPFGKRIAYDPAKQRLWTVCHSCGQWNLSSLDDDETTALIAKLENYYTATPSHAETGGIGVAELPHGVSLVRIGDVSWSRFAAWRYGARLRRRRRRWILEVLLVVAVLSFAKLRVEPVPFPETVASLLLGWVSFEYWKSHWRTLLSVPAVAGKMSPVTWDAAMDTRIHVDAQGWGLLVSHRKGASELRGADARRVLGIVLRHVNGFGATAVDVESAIALIERAGGAEGFLESEVATTLRGVTPQPLVKLPRAFRLAIEMSVHEQSERLALHSEAASLGVAAAEAQNVAAIVKADDL